MIVSDARAFQSTLKMQIFDHPSSNFNLRVMYYVLCIMYYVCISLILKYCGKLGLKLDSKVLVIKNYEARCTPLI